MYGAAFKKVCSTWKNNNMKLNMLFTYLMKRSLCTCVIVISVIKTTLDRWSLSTGKINEKCHGGSWDGPNIPYTVYTGGLGTCLTIVSQLKMCSVRWLGTLCTICLGPALLHQLCFWPWLRWNVDIMLHCVFMYQKSTKNYSESMWMRLLHILDYVHNNIWFSKHVSEA